MAERAAPVRRGPSLPARVVHSWRVLAPEQRLVALFAGGLVVSLLLPWYSKNSTAVTRSGLQTTHDATGGIWVFSFVEAAVLLIAAGTLVLLYMRAQDRAFHLPGGDGVIVLLAGSWASFLIFYRLLDQPAGGNTRSIVYEYGLAWGIFVALFVALGLAWSGFRLRAAHVVEPERSDELDTVAVRRADTAATAVVPRERRPPPPRIDGGEQLSFDEPE